MGCVRSVIVGVSGSPASLPAIRYAAGLARSYDAPLVAVHAWVPPGGELADRRQPSAYLRKMWAEAARERLHAAFDAAWGGLPVDLPVQPVVIRSEPGPGLVHLASGADLLVVGTGRRGRLCRIWRGQVSRYCLAHAPCPVIAVPPPALRPPGQGPRWSLRHRELTADQARWVPQSQQLRPDR